MNCSTSLGSRNPLPSLSQNWKIARAVVSAIRPSDDFLLLYIIHFDYSMLLLIRAQLEAGSGKAGREGRAWRVRWSVIIDVEVGAVVRIVVWAAARRSGGRRGSSGEGEDQGGAAGDQGGEATHREPPLRERRGDWEAEEGVRAAALRARLRAAERGGERAGAAAEGRPQGEQHQPARHHGRPARPAPRAPALQAGGAAGPADTHRPAAAPPPPPAVIPLIHYKFHGRTPLHPHLPPARRPLPHPRLLSTPAYPLRRRQLQPPPIRSPHAEPGRLLRLLSRPATRTAQRRHPNRHHPQAQHSRHSCAASQTLPAPQAQHLQQIVQGITHARGRRSQSLRVQQRQADTPADLRGLGSLGGGERGPGDQAQGTQDPPAVLPHALRGEPEAGRAQEEGVRGQARGQGAQPGRLRLRWSSHPVHCQARTAQTPTPLPGPRRRPPEGGGTRPAQEGQPREGGEARSRAGERGRAERGAEGGREPLLQGLQQHPLGGRSGAAPVQGGVPQDTRLPEPQRPPQEGGPAQAQRTPSPHPPRRPRQLQEPPLDQPPAAAQPGQPAPRQREVCPRPRLHPRHPPRCQIQVHHRLKLACPGLPHRRRRRRPQEEQPRPDPQRVCSTEEARKQKAQCSLLSLYRVAGWGRREVASLKRHFIRV